MKHSAILWILIPICTTLYQLFIKLAAVHMEGVGFSLAWLSHITITPWIWAAIVCEAVAFVVWMKILVDHNLSKAFPLSAVSYVLILCTGWFIFHEAILPLQLLGGTLILAGVWLIGTADHISKESV